MLPSAPVPTELPIGLRRGGSLRKFLADSVSFRFPSRQSRRADRSSGNIAPAASRRLKC